MSLWKELENALREIAEQQAGPAQPRRHPRRRTPAPPPLDDQPLEIIEAEPVREELADRKPFGGRGQTPRRHPRKSQLSQTDERVEARLHQKFDHKVGQLATTDADTTRPIGPSFAEEVVKLTKSPNSLVQAMILGEILKRPEERW